MDAVCETCYSNIAYDGLSCRNMKIIDFGETDAELQENRKYMGGGVSSTLYMPQIYHLYDNSTSDTPSLKSSWQEDVYNGTTYLSSHEWPCLESSYDIEIDLPMLNNCPFRRQLELGFLSTREYIGVRNDAGSVNRYCEMGRIVPHDSHDYTYYTPANLLDVRGSGLWYNDVTGYLLPLVIIPKGSYKLTKLENAETDYHIEPI